MDFNYGNVIQPIHGFIMRITPETAQEWLEQNIANNRNPKATGIMTYAVDMANGNWGLSPDAIAFDENGTLFNGQNRLNAVIKSGVTIEAFVVFGFPMHKKDFLNLDNGIKRSFKDMIRTGYTDDEAVMLGGDIASAYLRIKYTIRNISPNMRIDFIHANREIVMWTAELCRHSSFGTKRSCKKSGAGRVPSVIAIAIMDAYLCGESEEALRDFVNGYCDNNFNGMNQKQIDYLMELRKLRIPQTLEGLNIAKSYVKAFAKRLTKRYVIENDYKTPKLKMREEV